MKKLTVEKMQELMNNADFTEKMSLAGDVQDVIALMADYGIEVTEEEFEAGYEQAIQLFREQGVLQEGELSEEDLGAVAGGIRTGVCQAGLTVGYSGLLLMMAGAAAGPYLWLGGAAVAAVGLGMKKKKKKR